MIEIVNFQGNPPSTFTAVNGDPVSVSVSHMGIEISNTSRAIKSCSILSLEKVLLSHDGGHSWLYFHFSDGEIIELRSRSFSNNHGLKELQLKTRLILKASRAQARK